MRRLAFILFAISGVCASLVAGPADNERAAAVARGFLSGHGLSVSGNLRVVEPVGSVADVPYYIVNNDGGGYAIVAGASAGDAVLAYGMHGSLDPQSLPAPLSDWLAGYTRQMQLAGAQGGASPARALDDASPVAPMLTTTWNQGNPYNLLCPEVSGQHAWTGCVATAMAQIMRYWQWPRDSVPAVPAYTENGVTYDALPPTAFDWDLMTANYASVSDSDSIYAMARLMQYAGQAVRMRYSLNGSSAHVFYCPEAFTDVFGYDDGVQSIQRGSLPVERWEPLVYAELAAGRPVLYSGQSAKGSQHAFVCDGYDGDGYYHFNWGYGGTADGWFLLQAVNIQALRTDGGDDLGGFTFSPRIVIGIQPPVPDDVPVLDPNADRLLCDSVSMRTPLTVAYDAGTGFGSGTMRYQLVNNGEQSRRFRYGVGLFSGDELIATKAIGNTLFAPTGRVASSVSLGSFAPGLADGDYRLMMVSRVSGTSQWLVCNGADRHYVDVTVAGSEAVFSQVNTAVPIPYMVALSASVPVAFVGDVVRIDLRYQNQDDFEYKGPIYMLVDGSPVACEASFIAAGATDSLQFCYRGTVGGTQSVVFATDRYGSNVLGTAQVVVNERALSATAAFAGADYDNHWMVGTAGHQVNVTIHNGGESAFDGDCTVSLMSGDDAAGVLWQGNLQLQPGQDRDLCLDGSLAFGASYSICASYSDGLPFFASDTLQVIAGALCWYDDGDSLLSVSPQVPDDALAVFFAGLADGCEDLFVPNSNPNTVYYFAAYSHVPDAFAGLNTVVGDHALAFTITDGYDLYIPATLSADEVTFLYTPALGTDGNGSGWSTLVVPFDVSSAYNLTDDVQIDWFRNSEDSLKDFWLKELSTSGTDYVAFDHASSFNAHTPYIIAVPDDTWGPAYDLRGKTLAFRGYGIEGLQTRDIRPVANDADLWLWGTYTSRDIDDGAAPMLASGCSYLLNADGSAFERTTGQGHVAPFRAWFESTDQGLMQHLPIIRPDQSSVSLADATPGTTAVYSPDGMKIAQVRAVNGMPDLRSLPKGIYIANGRKYVRH